MVPSITRTPAPFINLTDTPQLAPSTPVALSIVDFHLDIEPRKSGGASWPLRTMQVVLTPAAVALDFVVTPALFVYYGFINPPRFMF